MPVLIIKSESEFSKTDNLYKKDNGFVKVFKNLARYTVRKFVLN